ncbi:MarR family transcriptional regulator [Carnobacteriaceae bacterium zg-ZUI252]|nr:MarR family transcriptional regulator [Carnobacteriaceae bacterium zg-ZUI252]MBS4770263.1 MarR family transcriptional regulator [Carnobacteriaceae bacterium zg-ZUI240]QTU83379.1 MarR family transcriptional regulator [Carnobacteriaceae bacterium zg-C25]
MANSLDVINQYLVKVFNEILDIEETALRVSQFSDLSIKEMHTIEAIGLHEELTSTQVANRLNITVGTLTVAVNNLVKKGYVERVKRDNDRRFVRLKLTKRGKLLFRLHAKFHKEMVVETLQDMDDAQVAALTKGLENLHHYLMAKQREQKMSKRK